MNCKNLTNDALMAYEAGDLERCVKLCRQVLRKEPENPDTLHMLGMVLLGQDRHAAAVKLLRKAAIHGPQNTSILNNLGVALTNIGRCEEAERAFRQALELAPGNTDYLGKLGACLQQQGRIQEAAGCLQQCLDSAASASQYYNYGLLMRRMDRLEEAEQAQLKALEIDPGHTSAWLYRVQLRHYRDPDHPDIRRLRGLLDSAGLKPGGRAELHFALGKCLDDCHQYGLAFERYRSGNRIMAGRLPYDADAYRTRITRIIDAYSDTGIYMNTPAATRDPAPIFITGISRSGKTRLERLLARHPDVHRGGELFALPGLSANWLASRNQWPPSSQTPPELIEEAARRYQDFTGRLAAGARYVTDTLPTNTEHLGLITLLFPKVRIINCRRDPQDTQLSIYFKHFGNTGYGYSYRLDSIHAHLQQHNRLMEHWRRHLPVPILEVSYEELVTQPAETMRRVAGFCDLRVSGSLAGEWNNTDLDDRWIGKAGHYRQFLAEG